MAESSKTPWVFIAAVAMTLIASAYRSAWSSHEDPRRVLTANEIEANEKYALTMRALRTPSCEDRLMELARAHPDWSAEKGSQWVGEDYNENKCTIDGKLHDGTDLAAVLKEVLPSSSQSSTSPSQPPKTKARSHRELAVGSTWDEALPKLNRLGPRQQLIALDSDTFIDVRAGRRYTFHRPSAPAEGPYRITSIR
jgi:hypothetical protein